ncbi:colicin uptake protein TolQ [Planctomycetes bacterium CA13]|uniref:Colicin uptake protein TolQ n=1 Tax=Novipirellula herctigrandis TaxID=2527986 RepID=A0A5C5Z708_9BACT|nr:colicin uptake protein TolQ [Planctomycetes bacterium CA13]
MSVTNRKLAAASVIFAALLLSVSALSAQDTGDVPINASDIQSIIADGENEGQGEAVGIPADESMHIDLLSLIGRGGRFMIPIGVMSLLVVALATERIVSLRQKKVIPLAFVEEMEDITEMGSRFDPSVAFRACEEFPSPGARVVRGMLLRTGQPIGEIENAAVEMIQREADKQSAPIRWLHLAAAATPLMGLLGTVWGMIVAFHESTTLTADRSRSEQLSEGIYTALVTTLAGLIVAIPAAILAQYLENRLAKLFHKIEELAFELAPRMVPFVGRRRLDANGNGHAMDFPASDGETPSKLPIQPPPPQPPPVSNKSRSGEKRS